MLARRGDDARHRRVDQRERERHAGGDRDVDVADGTVFDRVAIAVAEPASLAFDMGTSFSIGTSYAVGWTARDAKGNELMSTSGVHMTTSDASVIDFKRTFLSPDSSSVDAEDVIFGTTMEPRAHGDATITATAQNVTTTFQARVN